MKLAVPLIALLLLAGCSKAKDVAFYKENAAERGKKVSECDTYHDDSQACQDARKAMLEVYAAQVRPVANEAAPAENAAAPAAAK